MLRIGPEVAAALADGRPVVALESTLLAHGLPENRRAATVAALGRAIRGEGAVPAFAAILDGALLLGPTEAELARVCEEGNKASLRDLAIALAGGGAWATTVATTMAICHRAKVHVFATGGLGGVHRGDELDESADLIALAKFPVAVVSAGAKAVLDLPRTLERLETLGVPVIGYRTDELPGFYTARTGLRLEHRIDDEVEIARVMRARFELLEEGGISIVQAPPAPMDPGRVHALVAEALKAAAEAGVRGKNVTPYLLAQLDRSSNGGVVDANIALVLENARLAARVAAAYAAIRDDIDTLRAQPPA